MPIEPIKAGGWAQGQPLTPAHLNDFQAKLVGAGVDIDSSETRLLRIEKRALAEALFLRPLTPENAGSSSGVAAVSLENGGFSEGLGALVITNWDRRIARDDLRAETVDTGDGSLPIVDAAYQYGGDRIVAVYSTGNGNMYSDDFGSTWGSTASLGFITPSRIIWNEALGLFIVTSTTTTVARSSNVPSLWTSATHSLSSGGNGLACFASGRTVICGLDGGTPKVSISDDAISWSDSAGFPDHGGPGWLGAGAICGTNGSKIWHAGFIGSPGSGLRISESTDGETWTTIADFTTADDGMPPPALQPTANPRLLHCPNTGLLVVLGLKSGTGVFAVASRDGGVTWGDPAFFQMATSLGEFAVANGKLFHSVDETISMSDGIGWR